MNTIVKIQILGEVYKFKAEADASDAQEVADFLMKEFQKLEKSLGVQAESMDKTAKLLLLTMNIADTYLNLKQQCDDMLSVSNKETGRLLETLPENI